MSQPESIQTLWDQATQSHPASDLWQGASPSLPTAVQRYFNASIAPGTPLASAIRLKMHGEIKLGKWRPFLAGQVISPQRGFIWQAKLRLYGLPISGSDSLIHHQGQMRWNLFGLFPFLHAQGPDITRSAAGRMNIESLWLPSILASPTVHWSSADQTHITARFPANNEEAVLDFTLNDAGELQSASVPRWGNIGGGPYRMIPFGTLIEQTRTFAGFTIPIQLRVGWFFDHDHFDSNGEFFRVTIDSAEFIEQQSPNP